MVAFLASFRMIVFDVIRIITKNLKVNNESQRECGKMNIMLLSV